jgi:hypothetical protein
MPDTPDEQRGGPDRAATPLRPGTRLLHVGPPKTGTTSLQLALHRSRKALAEQQVYMPSPEVNPKDAVWGGIDFNSTEQRAAKWDRLVEATAETGDRIAVISSEFFADADDEHAQRVVKDLGGDDVHVVITLRPLVKVLPSWWQQFVQIGMAEKYEDWLDMTLNGTGRNNLSWRWERQQRHVEFLDRWIAASGADRLTVVVIDDTDHQRILRDFEALLGLEDGTLPLPTGINRSLTAAEVEFVRQCFEEFKRKGLPREHYRKYVVGGAVPRMKNKRTPDKSESKVTTPVWAQEKAVELGAQFVDHLRASGVAIVGDPERLKGTVKEQPEPDLRLDPAAAAHAALGMLDVIRAEEANR